MTSSLDIGHARTLKTAVLCPSVSRLRPRNAVAVLKQGIFLEGQRSALASGILHRAMPVSTMLLVPSIVVTLT